MTIQIVKSGKPILFDSQDWKLISRYRWWVESNGYAVTKRRVDGKYIKMHRLLLGIIDKPKILTDHKNRIRSDNRIENIRPCSLSENARNRRAVGRSKYKGVSFQRFVSNGNVYEYIQARIRVDGRFIHLGRFETEERAALAYNEAATKYFGEFANLNVL